MAATERWSKRTLQAKIDGMLYERTAIATKPEELIKQELADLRDNETLSPDLVFKSLISWSLQVSKACTRRDRWKIVWSRI